MGGKPNKTTELTPLGKIAEEKARRHMNSVWRLLQEEVSRQNKVDSYKKLEEKCGVSNAWLKRYIQQPVKDTIQFKQVLLLIYGLGVSLSRLAFAINPAAMKVMRFFESFSQEDFEILEKLREEDLHRLREIILAYARHGVPAPGRPSQKKHKKNK